MALPAPRPTARRRLGVRGSRALLASCAVASTLLAALPLACSDDTTVSPSPDAATASEAGEAAPPADAAADGGVPVVPRGARVLGLSVDITDQNFPANLDVAVDAGAQTSTVTFGWDEVEIAYDAGAPDPDAAAPPSTTLFNPGLHISNLVLSDRKVQAVLSLEAFDVGGSRAPADLRARPLDDAALEARYDALVDYAFDQLHDTTLTALVVASGADAWLAADPARGPALAAFVTHVASHAHGMRPEVKVGFSVDSVDGAMSHGAALAPAWAASDFAAVDDVPSVEVVATRPPLATFVAADLGRIAAAVPGPKPILLRQAGYPSAAAAASDEATQAAYVTATFQAWDAHADRFFAIVVRELDDETAAQAAAVAARRGRGDPAFLALTQSLGIRAAGPKDKAALAVLRREARARGW